MALVQVATDNFNRSNGAVGSNWTASPDEGFDLTILSNALKGQGGDAAGFWNANSFNNAQYSQITVTTAGNYSGVIVRGNASDYVVGQYIDGDVAIIWYNSGGYTQIARVAHSVVNGDILRLEAVGSAFSLYVNGTLRASGSNGSAPATGAAGVLCSSADVLDNWVGGNIVSTQNSAFFAFF